MPLFGVQYSFEAGACNALQHSHLPRMRARVLFVLLQYAFCWATAALATCGY